jgi:hypothetical protein
MDSNFWDEGGSVDAIAPLPTDGERGIGFLDSGRVTTILGYPTDQLAEIG